MRLGALLTTLIEDSVLQSEEEVAALLARFQPDAEELAPYITFSPRRYTRNRIAITPEFELLALCWESGQASPIHDHAGSVCGVRVLYGTAAEVRFKRTPAGMLIPTDTSRLSVGDVTVARDDDLHLVANAGPRDEQLVTLHLYSPPLERMTVYPLEETVFAPLLPDPALTEPVTNIEAR